MEFKEKIKFVRGELLLTQKELAKSMGISFATMNRWELGKTSPQLVQLKKFENFCKANNIVLPKD